MPYPSAFTFRREFVASAQEKYESAYSIVEVPPPRIRRQVQLCSIRMRLMRDALSKAVQRRFMPPASGKPGVQAQLDWIATLPASREAERLLALAEVGAASRDPMLPALLTLLQWALEEVPGLDKSRALATWERLMQLDLRGDPKTAVLGLLSCDDPEHEIPNELLANSADEAAKGIVSLAASAWRRPSRSGKSPFSAVKT